MAYMVTKQMAHSDFWWGFVTGVAFVIGMFALALILAKVIG